MAIVSCEKGHYYDNDKYFRCPYCGIRLELTDDNQNEEGEEATVKRAEWSKDDDRTVAFYGDGNDDGEYVTGWLVCIAGPQKGRDYRIHYGFNRIGRSYMMDICVEDDLGITRDNHCSVVYDDKENLFSLIPARGTITYVNGKILMQAIKLQTEDRITIGESTFEFIAFCRGDKKWQEDML